MDKLQRIHAHLLKRGLLHSSTLSQNSKQLSKGIKSPSAYCGFDPTAPLPHLGNLLQLLSLARCSVQGIRPIILLGTATATIGDISGKIGERKTMKQADVDKNSEKMGQTLLSLAENIAKEAKVEHSFELLQNRKFYEGLGYLEFLEKFGSRISMSTMLGKEAVSSRLNNEDSLSYAQFSYQIIQAIDFLKLFRSQDCVLQIGGSDQWGNIIGGVDLIGKFEGQDAHGLTTNLLLDSQGRKFGKSEGGAIFLDPTDENSFFNVWQYFINIADCDVERLLLTLTFLPEEQIQAELQRSSLVPEERLAQKLLAETVMRYLSQDQQVIDRVKNYEKYFSLDFASLETNEQSSVKAFLRTLPKLSNTPLTSETKLKELLKAAFPSKSGRELQTITSAGGVSINGRKETSIDKQISDILPKGVEFAVLGLGKKEFVTFLQ